MRKGRVLVVDDSAAVRKEVATVLAASGDLEVVAECEDGLSALRVAVETLPDVVLCDLVMPACDGLQFLRLKASRPELEAVPVIMLTSDDDQDHKVALLERGAADYITKPFHHGELLARVRIHVRLRALQDELKQANARLYQVSCTDFLTGIFNRRHLDKVLAAEVARHHRYATPVTVVLADIDHFKSVNDDFGHATGDAVLKGISHKLQSLVRSGDVVARFGGEEICVVLTNTGSSGSEVLAERLREALEGLEHPCPDAPPLRVTASFGVASAEGKDPNLSASELLARADQALYAAKHAGRNRVVLWTSALPPTSAQDPK